MTDTKPFIYVAADSPDLDRVKEIANMVHDAGQGLKLGLEFFNAQGPQGVAAVKEAVPDLPVFLDLKYHDIPNTVAGAAAQVAKLDLDYINVHAGGGTQMMMRAREAAIETAEKAGVRIPKVLAVTILTSLDNEDLQMMAYGGGPVEQVIRLGRMAQEAELDGLVCSPQEIAPLRRELNKDLVLMVPGIRPADADQGDQKRVMTPADALESGADHLVVGRPVTQAGDPAKAIRDILDSLAHIN